MRSPLTSFETVEFEGGEVSIRTDETAHDPLVVPAAVALAVERFDGRPTAEVLREIRTAGVLIDDETLRLLVDEGLLAPPDDQDVPPARQPSGPLQPDDWLCFFRSFRSAEVSSEVLSGDLGQQVLEVRCGPREVTFDEQELIEFGRRLVVHQDGFRAADALSWNPPGVTYPALTRVLIFTLGSRPL